MAAAIQPWAVVLQVTPIVAIAPLIIVWVGDPFASLVVCATIVAFFPVFANTAAGLASAPAELADLFRLYGAGRFATLWLLRLPAALPYFLAGLRISGGLALVGAVVAEFVAGSGGFASGLAYRILEAGYRLQVPRMFAALVLLSLAGIAINFGLGLLPRRSCDTAATAEPGLNEPHKPPHASQGAPQACKSVRRSIHLFGCLTGRQRRPNGMLQPVAICRLPVVRHQHRLAAAHLLEDAPG